MPNGRHLSLLGTLTQLQAGIAIISTISGGIFIGVCSGKDNVQKLDSILIKENDLLISEKNFSEKIPVLPLRIMISALESQEILHLLQKHCLLL